MIARSAPNSKRAGLFDNTRRSGYHDPVFSMRFDTMVTAAYLVAGLAFFLYGIDLLGTLLARLAGGRLSERLDRLAPTDGRRYLWGLLATVLFQSSSATTVLLVSMASAGFITAAESFSFVLGANLGAVSTGWIAAVKMTLLGLPLFVLGVTGRFFLQRAAWRDRADFSIGLGLILFGLDLMTRAMAGLRDDATLVALFAQYAVADSVAALLFVTLGGILFTALVQSSGATLAIAVAGAAHGLFTLHQAGALVLGATLGTTITALLAALGAGGDGKRTALLHSGLNVVGVIGGLLLFYPLIGAAELARPFCGVGVAVALYLTLHKILLTGTMYLFRGSFARRISRLVPERFPGVGERLRIPAGAPDRDETELRAELHRQIDLFAQYLRGMLSYALIVSLKRNERALIARIEQYEQVIDQGHKKIARLIHDLGGRHQHDLWLLFKMSGESESIADHVRSLAGYGLRLRERSAAPHSLERYLIHSAHRRVFLSFHRICLCRCFDRADIARCAENEREIRRHKRELLLSITEPDAPLDTDAVLDVADILSEYSKINHSVKRILQVNLDILDGRAPFRYREEITLRR